VDSGRDRSASDLSTSATSVGTQTKPAPETSAVMPLDQGRALHGPECEEAPPALAGGASPMRGAVSYFPSTCLTAATTCFTPSRLVI
jgi:hypothetical protein